MCHTNYVWLFAAANHSFVAAQILSAWSTPYDSFGHFDKQHRAFFMTLAGPGLASTSPIRDKPRRIVNIIDEIQAAIPATLAHH